MGEEHGVLTGQLECVRKRERESGCTTACHRGTESSAPHTPTYPTQPPAKATINDGLGLGKDGQAMQVTRCPTAKWTGGARRAKQLCHAQQTGNAITRSRSQEDLQGWVVETRIRCHCISTLLDSLHFRNVGGELLQGRGGVGREDEER